MGNTRWAWLKRLSLFIGWIGSTLLPDLGTSHSSKSHCFQSDVSISASLCSAEGGTTWLHDHGEIWLSAAPTLTINVHEDLAVNAFEQVAVSVTI